MSTKLKAYYQNDGTWHTMSRWEMLAMSETEYTTFRDTYTLHLSKDSDSEKLTFNRLQKTFRYYPTPTEREHEEESGMTISHLIAQEVICDMDELNLKLTDRRTKKTTQYEIHIKRSNSLCEYRAGKFIFDIRIFFNEPQELALKWGGKLNIEVFATSRTKGDKIAYCEEMKEPLIEVRLSEKLLSRHKISEVTPEMEQEIRIHLERAFTRQIYADLLVSPSSESYLRDKVIAQQNKEIERLKKELRDNKSDKGIISKIKNTLKLRKI